LVEIMVCLAATDTALKAQLTRDPAPPPELRSTHDWVAGA
jgi:hypothetical protein